MGHDLSNEDPCQANSMKFKMPTVKVQNTCDSDHRTLSETLYDICHKHNDEEVNSYLSEQINKAIVKKREKAANMIRTQSNSSVCNINLESDTNKLMMLNFYIPEKENARGKTGVALLDTGCELNICTEEFLGSIIKSEKLKPANLTLVCINGTMQNSVLGKVRLKIMLFDQDNVQHSVDTEFLVVKTLSTFHCILGYKFFNSPELNISLSTQVLKMVKDGEELSFPVLPCLNKNLTYIYLLDDIKIDEKSWISASCALINKEIKFNVESEIYLTDSLEKAQIDKKDHYSFIDNGIKLSLVNTGNSCYTAKRGQIIGFIKNVYHSTQLNSIKFNEHLKVSTEHDTENELKDFLETVIPTPDENPENWSYKDCEIQGDSEIQSKFLTLLSSFQDIIAKNALAVGETDFIQHNIQLIPNKKLVSQKRRRIYGDKRAYCEKAIKQWEEMKVIRKCHNPRMLSNINVVNKPSDIFLDGTRAGKINNDNKSTEFRLTVDQRNLNDCTRNISSPLTPTPDDIIGKLRGKRCSCIDLKNAFYTIKIKESCQDLTSFYFDDQVYCFNRLVMGLSSSPATYVHYMNLMFSKENFAKILDQMDIEKQALLQEHFSDFSDFIIYYFDDLYVFTTEIIEIHLVALEAALLAIRNGGSIIGPKKTKIYATECIVLGLSVKTKSGEIQLSYKKAQAFLNWSTPSSLAELQSRLHSTSYFNRFLPNLKTIMSPLYYMLRSQSFYWTQIEQKAWREFKSLVSTDIALTIPSPNEQLVLYTDASKAASGQILFVDRDNELQIVAANSRLFDPQTSLKPTHFKELLSLTYGIKAFIPYLCASEKTPILFCDAKNLISLNRNKETSILAVSLSDFLSHASSLFEFEIYSVPGHLNFLSDLFSRHLPNSRFIDRQSLSVSKEYVTLLPKDDLKGKINSTFLKKFLSTPVEPSLDDKGSKKKQPAKTLNDEYRLYKGSTPEYSFYLLTCLLRELSRSLCKIQLKDLGIVISDEFLDSLKSEAVRKELFKKNSPEPNVVQFNKHLNVLVKNAIVDVMGGDIEKTGKTKIINACTENLRKMIKINAEKENDTPLSMEESQKLESFLNTKLSHVHVNTIHSKCSITFDTSGLEPRRQHSDDAGIDLPVQESFTIKSNETKLIDSGIKFRIPKQFCGVLYLRSSSFEHFSLCHGVIDAQFRGTIRYRIKNISNKEVFVKKGTFLCQMVLHKISVDLLEKDDINCNETTRGDKGFGEGSRTKINSLKNGPPKHKDDDDDQDDILANKKLLFDMQKRLEFLEQELESQLHQEKVKKVDFNIPESPGNIIPNNPFYLDDEVADSDLTDYSNYAQNQTSQMQVDTFSHDSPDHQYLELDEAQSEVEQLRKNLYAQAMPSPISGSSELKIDDSIFEAKVTDHPYNVEQTEHKKDAGRRLSFNPKQFFQRSNSDPKLSKNVHVLKPPDIPPRRFSEKDQSLLNENAKRNFSKIFSPDKDSNLSPEHKKIQVESPDISVKNSDSEGESSVHLITVTEEKIDKFLSTYLFHIETNQESASSYDSIIKVANLNLNNAINHSINPDIFVTLQTQCPVLDQIYTLAKNNSLEKFKLHKNLLYTIDNKLCVPSVVMPSLIKKIHDLDLHDTADHLKVKFMRYFFHPNASKMIQLFVDNCITCKLTSWKFKSLNSFQDDRTIRAKRPLDVLSVDILPNLPNSNGYNHLLITVDEFSFYTMAFPLKNKSSTEIIAYIETIFICHGPYKVIRSDNDTCLIKALSEIKKKYLTQSAFIAPYVKSQNVAETAVSFFKNKLGKYIYKVESPNNKTCWPSAIVEICNSINNCIPNYSNLANTRATRRELFFNIHNRPPFENLLTDQDDNQTVKDSIKQRTNQSKKSDSTQKHKFERGDLIFIRDHRPLPGQFKLKLIPTLFKICNTYPGSKNVEVQNLDNLSRKLVSWTDIVSLTCHDYFNPDSLKIKLPEFEALEDTGSEVGEDKGLHDVEEDELKGEEDSETKKTETSPLGGDERELTGPSTSPEETNWTKRLRPRK